MRPYRQATRDEHRCHRPLFRSLAAVAFCIAAAASASAQDVSTKLRAVSGARTRIVWSHLTTTEPAENGLPPVTDQAANADVSRARLYGIDTDDGLGVRCIRDQVEGYMHPIMTPAGSRIIYTDVISEGGAKAQVFVCSFDGTSKTYITDGHASEVRRFDGEEWVYVVQGYSADRQGGWGTCGDRVVRYRIDDPTVNELVWDNTFVAACFFRVSADGTRAGGGLDSPHALSVAVLPNGGDYLVSGGCWPCIAPDNSYDFFCYVSGHAGVSFFEHTGPGLFDYASPSYISFVPSATDPNPDHQAIRTYLYTGSDMYHARWAANNAEFMVTTGPLDDGHLWFHTCYLTEVFFGKFEPGYVGTGRLAAWVRVTYDESTPYADYYPSAWIDPGDIAIWSFTAEDTTVVGGQSTTLSWECVNATAVSIEPGIGDVALVGTTLVWPTDATTYTLTAEGPGGPVIRSVTVDVSADGPGTGVLREVWHGIAGEAITDLMSSADYPYSPDDSALVNALAMPAGFGADYGARLRGYLNAPQTGEYVFNITSDASSRLLLSLSEIPADALPIAGVDGRTAPGEWDVLPMQESTPVWLESDQRYYVEVVHKAGAADAHMGVRWSLPDGQLESPIPAHRLDPFDPRRPELELSTDELLFTAPEGRDPPDAYVAANNVGAGILDAATPSVVFQLGSGWLTLSVWGTGNDQSVANHIDQSGVAVGTYAATVTIECANAINPTQQYTVILTVTDAPTIDLLSPLGGEVWPVGAVRHIRWSTSRLSNVDVMFTGDDGANWELLATVNESLPDWGAYPWIVPDLDSALCRVRVEGYYDEAVATSATFGIHPPADTDGDEMDDSWETAIFGDLTRDGTEDEDADGLSDADEYHWNTDPTEADTDGDGMPDGWEADHGLDPLANSALGDADGDGHSNIAEYASGSDPSDPASVPASDDDDSSSCALGASGLGSLPGLALCACLLLALARRRLA